MAGSCATNRALQQFLLRLLVVEDSANRDNDDVRSSAFPQASCAMMACFRKTKRWTGQMMEFGFKAKLGLLTYTINGRVEVSDRQFAIDIELGWLAKCLPQGKTEEIETRVRGLIA